MRGLLQTIIALIVVHYSGALRVAFRSNTLRSASKAASLRMVMDTHTALGLGAFGASLPHVHHSLTHGLDAWTVAATVAAPLEPHVSVSSSMFLSDAANTAMASGEKIKYICPKFGEEGWGPLCFLNGNPVFGAFDKFQAFIQSSVLALGNDLKARGVPSPFAASIILFTIIVRTACLPLTYKQLASSQASTALNPKIAEIKEKFPNDKDMQNQLTALLFEEAQTNPLAGCLPALVQIPVFIALYRSFFNLALSNQMAEPFLWLPNLEGPVFGVRSSAWITSEWVNGVPPLGWHDTIAYASMPLLLMATQAISLRILTPPSDDPQVQKSQRILKYFPLMIGYFSLSFPSGLGLYYITNSILSTFITYSIKDYFKKNPIPGLATIDIDQLAAGFASAAFNPTWGYYSKESMIEEARKNEPIVKSKRAQIPADFD